MKRSALFLALIAGVTFALNAQVKTLEIGNKAVETSYKMADVNGKMVSLDDVKLKNGTLVIFSCNTCPFVVAWEDRYAVVAELAKKNNVGMILVNSNHRLREKDDSPQAIKDHAKKHNYNFPYVIDENSKLANAFGALTTPHVFLFDKSNSLVYAGAIDDNHKKASDVKEFWLKDALNAVGSGKEIAVKTSRATGCSIKRP